MLLLKHFLGDFTYFTHFQVKCVLPHEMYTVWNLCKFAPVSCFVHFLRFLLQKLEPDAFNAAYSLSILLVFERALKFGFQIVSSQYGNLSW